MTDSNHNPALDHDHDLAEFTDKVLNRQSITLSDSQSEKGLQEVIMALHANTADDPPEVVKQRIKGNVQAIYAQTVAQGSEKNQKSLLSFLGIGQKDGYRSRSQRQRTAAIQLAVAAVVVTTILVFTLPSSGDPGGQTGTATGSLGLLLPMGIFLLAGIAVFWIWFRNRD